MRKIEDMFGKKGRRINLKEVTIVEIPLDKAIQFERELVENSILNKLKNEGLEIYMMNKKDPVDFESPHEVIINGAKFNRGEVGRSFYKKFENLYKKELESLKDFIFSKI